MGAPTLSISDRDTANSNGSSCCCVYGGVSPVYSWMRPTFLLSTFPFRLLRVCLPSQQTRSGCSATRRDPARRPVHPSGLRQTDVIDPSHIGDEQTARISALMLSMFATKGPHRPYYRRGLRGKTPIPTWRCNDIPMRSRAQNDASIAGSIPISDLATHLASTD